MELATDVAQLDRGIVVATVREVVIARVDGGFLDESEPGPTIGACADPERQPRRLQDAVLVDDRDAAVDLLIVLGEYSK